MYFCVLVLYVLVLNGGYSLGVARGSNWPIVLYGSFWADEQQKVENFHFTWHGSVWLGKNICVNILQGAKYKLNEISNSSLPRTFILPTSASIHSFSWACATSFTSASGGKRIRWLPQMGLNPFWNRILKGYDITNCIFLKHSRQFFSLSIQNSRKL